MFSISMPNVTIKIKSVWRDERVLLGYVQTLPSRRMWKQTRLSFLHDQNKSEGPENCYFYLLLSIACPDMGGDAQQGGDIQNICNCITLTLVLNYGLPWHADKKSRLKSLVRRFITLFFFFFGCSPHCSLQTSEKLKKRFLANDCNLKKIAFWLFLQLGRCGFCLAVLVDRLVMEAE